MSEKDKKGGKQGRVKPRKEVTKREMSHTKGYAEVKRTRKADNKGEFIQEKMSQVERLLDKGISWSEEDKKGG